LKTSAVISQLADSVQYEVYNFFTNGVVTTGEVVSSVFFTRNQLFRVEELTIGSSTDFINDSGLQIDEHASRNVFASTSFREKGVESIITSTNSFVRGHLTIRLDTVLQAEKLPAGVTNLDTSLVNMNTDGFTHD
jgi:hypothetical protein